MAGNTVFVITSQVTRFFGIVGISFNLSARCFGVRGDYCNVQFTGATIQREILREAAENFHGNVSICDGPDQYYEWFARF